MRRGSALLIVLGMIAFMVISAVAFSAFMRNSRLPSSYLRRTSYSRLLVKAALAEAIDLIDISIGDNPHPGVGTRAYPYPRRSTANESSSTRQRNYWRNRVFIGTNQLVNAADTVSTLTFEALAYLPPALINETRYYSRRSAAACWHNLGFDSGRYAFTAVDVSDHFDINRVFADRGRNSSDSGRITLAHVFENASHTGAGSPSASDWDGFISKFNDAVDVAVGQRAPAPSASKLPFVSLADMNLAINKQGWAENMSPFCRYFTSKGGTDFVTSAAGADSEMMRLMTFVTDSYMPSTNDANSAKYDLCVSQPFGRMYHEKNRQMSYMDQLDGSMSTPILERLYDKVTELDTVSLYDYLDENDIPTSLALPSVERVPMICGLEPSVSFQLEPEKKLEYNPTTGLGTPPTALSQVLQERRIYKLKVVNAVGQMRALCLYPFRRDKDADQGKSFKVDFALRIGFAAGNGPGFRQQQSAFAITDKSDFEAKRDGVKVENGVIKIHATANGTVKCSNVNRDTDAFSTLTATLNLSDLEDQSAATELFTVTYRYKAKENPNAGLPGASPFIWDETNPDIDPSVPPTVNMGFFHPLAANGTGDGGFTVDYLKNKLETCVVKPFMTVAARVYSNQSQKYVDLVPAHYRDDLAYNSIDNDSGEFGDVCGTTRPLLTLGGGKEITFSEAAFSASGAAVQEDLSPAEDGGSLICPDPRWNFAPENFYVRGGTLPDAQTFVQNCDLEKGGRDCDIFMACSNQGYMQSPSEFAFLPRTTTARLPIAGSQYGNAAPNYNNFTAFEKSEGTAPYDRLAHGRLMWKTYQVYAREGIDDDNLYGFGLTVSGSGPRVNPYTDSRDVMMAALANTPYSWWAASTNLLANNNLADKDADSFNRNYAFNGMNSNARFDWKDLQKVADRFISVFRDDDGDWAAGFHDLDWDGENSDLCGVDFDSTNADDLYDVDRKFLYGFWRDSFAPKQQLFLVFVRAEPMMMGGGAIGQTPPQLGARAVALVWRDPVKRGSEDGDPHQTRILFYRQFD